MRSARAIPFLGLLLIQPIASARTWTSRDGRTIEGTMQSKNKDSVVVLRADGNAVTIPFLSLSPGDVSYVRHNEPEASGTGSGNIVTVIANFPKLEIHDDNDKQLFKKYEGWVKIMTPANAKATAEMMRKKLPDDVKYWTEQAEQEGKSLDEEKRKIMIKGTTGQYREFSKLMVKKKAFLKARVTWLSKTLPDWLDAVKKAAPKE